MASAVGCSARPLPLDSANDIANLVKYYSFKKKKKKKKERKRKKKKKTEKGLSVFDCGKRKGYGWGGGEACVYAEVILNLEILFYLHVLEDKRHSLVSKQRPLPYAR
jgi:hypothetical protein